MSNSCTCSVAVLFATTVCVLGFIWELKGLRHPSKNPVITTQALGCARGVSGANRRVPGCRWGELEFPLPFGRSMTSAEEYVHSLDGKTGASLKLSILNPKGRIWTMVAGGGASVIYAGANSPKLLHSREFLAAALCLV